MANTIQQELQAVGVSRDTAEKLAELVHRQDRVPGEVRSWMLGLMVAVAIAAIGWQATEIRSNRDAIDANRATIVDNAKAIALVEEKVDGLDQRMSRIEGALGQIRQILLDRLPSR